jgi:hypothetical protein
MIDLGLSNISQKGKEIYNKLKADFENSYLGQFVAIDVDTEEYFIDSVAENALKKAKEKYPNNIFYLAKIGEAGVFRLNSFYAKSILVA